MTRGGKREGAGRPKGTTKEKKVNYHRRVKPEWVEYLDTTIKVLKIKEQYGFNSILEAVLKEEQCQ